MTTAPKTRVLYVTDSGSISIAGHLYKPGEEIPIEAYHGRREALIEHVSTGLVTRMPSLRARTDKYGRVIKIDRSSNMPPLPSAMDAYDPKRKREMSPISSRVDNVVAQTELDLLARTQDARAAQRAREAAELAAQLGDKPKPKQPKLSDTELKDLEETLQTLEPDESEFQIYDDADEDED